MLQQLAGRLPAGAPVAWCERVAEALLTSDTNLLVALGPTRGHLTSVAVIRRGDRRVVPVDAGERRYTTKGLLLTEQRAINRSMTRHDAQVGIAPPRLPERAIGRRSPTDEQQAMVRRLTGSGAGVEVVVGKAGTGKTYALDAARDAWEASGVQVTGVALAARAALELQTSAGIRSTTLARLLGQVDDRREGSPLQPGSVLVVDEAGMVGTRQLARLLDHAEQQSVKVVLVGDPKQLPEIDAGGLFRALATRLPAIELTHNRRQAHGWEQAALDDLRHGDPDVALAAYRSHGRIRTADTAEQLRDRLVTDWWGTAKENLSGSLMIALRRDDVADLNHRARTKMLAAGRLTGPTITTGSGIELQAGDRIVCLRNDRRLGVVNGTRATITRTAPTRRTVEAVDDRGVRLLLPASYLDAGHVAHGYAITRHKAQGLTCDHTYTLGTDTLYREWGYVAMSRGRITNQLYHGPTDRDDDGLHHHAHVDDRDEVASLTSRLRRSRAEVAVSPKVTELAAEWRWLQDYLSSRAVQQQPYVASEYRQRSDERAVVLTRISELETRQQGALLPAVRRRTRAQRRYEAAELDRQRERLGRIDGELARLESRVAASPSPGQIAAVRQRHEEIDHELRGHIAVLVDRTVADPPAYLQATLGRPPSDPTLHRRWHRAVARIVDYRIRWDVSDPQAALGSAVPVHQEQARARDDVARLLRDRRPDAEELQYRARSRGRAR